MTERILALGQTNRDFILVELIGHTVAAYKELVALFHLERLGAVRLHLTFTAVHTEKFGDSAVTDTVFREGNAFLAFHRDMIAGQFDKLLVPEEINAAVAYIIYMRVAMLYNQQRHGGSSTHTAGFTALVANHLVGFLHVFQHRVIGSHIGVKGYAVGKRIQPGGRDKRRKGARIVPSHTVKHGKNIYVCIFSGFYGEWPVDIAGSDVISVKIHIILIVAPCVADIGLTSRPDKNFVCRAQFAFTS